MTNEHLDEGPSVTLVDRGINIDFASYYQKDIVDYNYFSLSKKRNFITMAERSGCALATLLTDPDFVWGLLALRFDISTPKSDLEYVSEEELPLRIADLFNDNVLAIIESVVNDIYLENEINIDTENSGRNNEELQFTNEHALIILKWNFACIASTPIITTYMDEQDIQARNSMNLIIGVFCALLRKFEPENSETDILAKIKKLVESRVLQTRYSDKIMWNYLRNVAIDPYIFIDRLFRKFIAEGIPKLEQGTNIIKFFHTFLKNQIKYQFTAKFPISYKPIRPDIIDLDGSNAMEHLESELIRRDEAVMVIGDLICKQAIKGILSDLNWEPSKAEVFYWMEKIKEHGLSNWTKGIVIKFFLPKITKIEYIQTRTLQEFVIMFLITRYWLNKNGFKALYDYMSSKISDGIDSRKLLARKKFIYEFIDSTAYKDLLEKCFPITSQNIIDSNVIIDMISAVYLGNFIKISEYNVTTDSSIIVSYRVETVAQEVIRFIAHISRRT
jgi:hypothetical protein